MVHALGSPKVNEWEAMSDQSDPLCELLTAGCGGEGRSTKGDSGGVGIVGISHTCDESDSRGTGSALNSDTGSAGSHSGLEGLGLLIMRK
jgi:hypothetical protein